ncbi:hypothetical protein RI129_004794 [Pyrocoelia pectoralis]|uniref:CRAL-TRIO domain-containing protein n=1 Tax=Pyrocoelia pectoralis TaxID=417401 RepID=A0AAN7VD07_9COLE
MVLSIECGSDKVPYVQLGEHTLRLDLEELNEEYRERSRIELRETPENVDRALHKLRTLLKDEEDLNVPLDEPAFLIKFLRPCKFYPDSAFRLMKRYYKFKYKHPELSSNLMPITIKHVLEDDVISFVAVRLDHGCRMMVVDMAKWNVKNVTVTDMFRTILLVLEVGMIEPMTQVAGVHVLLDMHGLTLSHIWQFTPSFAKTALEFIQECTAIRLKGIHIVNQPFIFKMLWSIFKPFIGEKLRKRIFFHGTDISSFHSHISKELLPKAYYGTLDIPELPGSLLADILIQYNEEFENCNKIGYAKGI